MGDIGNWDTAAQENVNCGVSIGGFLGKAVKLADIPNSGAGFNEHSNCITFAGPNCEISMDIDAAYLLPVCRSRRSKEVCGDPLHLASP
jgi:hypothetical protein